MEPGQRRCRPSGTERREGKGARDLAATRPTPAQNPWRRQPPAPTRRGPVAEPCRPPRPLGGGLSGRCGVAQVSRLAAASSSTSGGGGEDARAVARRGVPRADGQPGADGGGQRRPFEGQLGDVGEQAAAPAAERDADGDGVDARSRRATTTSPARRPTRLVWAAEQPEQERRGEDAEVLGGDGDASRRGCRSSVGCGAVEPATAGSMTASRPRGERRAEHRGAGDDEVAAWFSSVVTIR